MMRRPSGRTIDTVLGSPQANGLMKADIFGGTDAYCDVYWNDALVGKTPVVEDSQSPEFDAAFRVQVRQLPRSPHTQRACPPIHTLPAVSLLHRSAHG